MINIIEIKERLKDFSSSVIWVGLSGGVDSIVLLDICLKVFQTEQSLTVKAIHIDEGLGIASTKQAEFCQNFCKQRNIFLKTIQITYDTNASKGLEAGLREARLRAFKEQIKPTEILLLAHTLDDQAETLLMRLFRGTGLKGLEGMHFKREINGLTIVRPLLNYPKSSVYHYAKLNQLDYIEDVNNENLSIDRNFIRLEILPLIKQRWVKAPEKIANLANLCQENNNEFLSSRENKFKQISDPLDQYLIISKLIQLPLNEQNEILRIWFNKHHLEYPSTKQLLLIHKTVIRALIDKNPKFKIGNYLVLRHQDKLYLKHQDNFLTGSFIPEGSVWDLNNPLEISKGKCLYAHKEKGKGIDPTTINNNQLTIRFRKGGEVFRSSNSPFTRPLKKMLQDIKLPPWERDKIPLFYNGEELVAVADLWVREGYQVASEKLGFVISIRNL
ncbi:MAG: tilS [Francisellaceae bacterium]|nr:tilS [Francisellaceae bacterium]